MSRPDMEPIMGPFMAKSSDARQQWFQAASFFKGSHPSSSGA